MTKVYCIGDSHTTNFFAFTRTIGKFDIDYTTIGAFGLSCCFDSETKRRGNVEMFFKYLRKLPQDVVLMTSLLDCDSRLSFGNRFLNNKEAKEIIKLFYKKTFEKISKVIKLKKHIVLDIFSISRNRPSESNCSPEERLYYRHIINQSLNELSKEYNFLLLTTFKDKLFEDDDGYGYKDIILDNVHYNLYAKLSNGKTVFVEIYDRILKTLEEIYEA